MFGAGNSMVALVVLMLGLLGRPVDADVAAARVRGHLWMPAAGATRIKAATSVSRDVIASHELAREVVDERWPSLWTSELPCAPARMHGPVEKQATASQSPTLRPRTADVRQYARAELPIYSRCMVQLRSGSFSPACACATVA